MSYNLRRKLIGIFALVCVASALTLALFVERPQENGLIAALGRVGVVLAALWLAWPTRDEGVVWRKAGPALTAAAVLVAIIGRRLIYLVPVAIVVGLAVAFLRPRIKGRRGRNVPGG